MIPCGLGDPMINDTAILSRFLKQLTIHLFTFLKWRC